jgi:hypothetical protein
MRKIGFKLGILTTPWWLFTVLLFGELQGGLVQRLTILIVLIWVSALSWYLIKRVSPRNKSNNFAPAAPDK